MTAPEEEITYYRAVEDFFATLRGVPHVLSPKDFQLLRSWWRDGVPLVAVTNGIMEVFARRRDRGDEEPISSLSYCRHAVSRHARRISEMRVGAAAPEQDGAPDVDGRDALGHLEERLQRVAEEWSGRAPEVARAVREVARRLEDAVKLPPALLQEHLFTLEAVLLSACLRALPEEQRTILEERARAAAAATGATEDAAERTRRAIRDRELRELVGLPRMELG
jgi:hypothetical protein